MKKLLKSTIASKKSRLAFAAKAAFTTVATTASSLVLAVDDTVVTAAQEAGVTSVTNATNGLLLIIAVMVGIGIVISVLKKA